MGIKQLAAPWLLATGIASGAAVPFAAEAHNLSPDSILTPAKEKPVTADKTDALQVLIDAAIQHNILTVQPHENGVSYYDINMLGFFALINVPESRNKMLKLLAEANLALVKPAQSAKPAAVGQGQKKISQKGKKTAPKVRSAVKTHKTTSAKGSAAVNAIPSINENELILHTLQNLTAPSQPAKSLSALIAEEKLSPTHIAKMQISLNMDGYGAGFVNGIFTAETADAVHKFLTENPLESLFVKRSIIDALGKHLTKSQMDILFENNEGYISSVVDGFDSNTYKTPSGRVLLNPELVAAMEKRPEMKAWVEAAMSAAVDPNYKSKPIDPHRHANQLWRELLFLYNSNPVKYHPGYENQKECVGIGQFKRATAKAYGLDTDEKLKNPILNSMASAYHMRDLTEDLGDQGLGEAAYNGRKDVVEWVARETGKVINGFGHKKLTEDDLVAFLDEQYRKNPVKNKMTAHLWRHETREYVRSINSKYWPTSQRQRALSFEVNTKDPALAWQGELDEEKQERPKNPEICSLPIKNERENKIRDEIANTPGLVEQGGKYTQKGVIEAPKIKARFDPPSSAPACIEKPPANSAQFFEDAARGYPVTGKFEKPVPTPATPPVAYRLEL